MHFRESGRAVSMSPDGKIVWQTYSTSEGTLYLPPDADDAVVQLIGRRNRWREK